MSAAPDVPTRAARLLTWNNTAIELAPIQAEDGQALEAFLGQLSARTLYLRYFAPLQSFSPDRMARERQRMLDGGARTLIGRIAGNHAIVTVMEFAYSHGAGSSVAELALTVADPYQRQGIGRTLFRHVPILAADHGIQVIEATTLAENTAVRALFNSFQPNGIQRSGDTISYRIVL